MSQVKNSLVTLDNKVTSSHSHLFYRQNQNTLSFRPTKLKMSTRQFIFLNEVPTTVCSQHTHQGDTTPQNFHSFWWSLLLLLMMEKGSENKPQNCHWNKSGQSFCSIWSAARFHFMRSFVLSVNRLSFLRKCQRWS